MVTLYCTAPWVRERTPAGLDHLNEVPKWAERAGVRGLLLFTDGESIDPWAAAQYILERTEELVPLVAVQPAYLHPYSAARMVTTMGTLYGRGVDLNLITGGYLPELYAYGSFLKHDERYERLLEYGTIMGRLIGGEQSYTHRGKHYEFIGATLHPALPEGLEPRIFVAGNSPAAVRTAAALDATRLTYPHPPSEHDGGSVPSGNTGIRIGIIARETSAEAWRIALRRYPENPAGRTMREFTAGNFDADWHSGLWKASGRPTDATGAYWLRPFRLVHEFCPYLVGNYEEVAEILLQYLRLGVTTVILHCPEVEEDVFHAMAAVRRAEDLVPS
ncbi:LLM class flavin-dependent oxidoreductase [Actinomadura sp. B10D3]|uniref:LLM class flavin-dependent oxidoreductase n=1 Tax=Actinomadura sp. B10D3 TaxID=3153557 RepID=UPI00325EC6AC